LAFCVGIAYDHLKNDKESIWARTVRQPKHERRSDENVKEPLPWHFFASVFCCWAKNSYKNANSLFAIFSYFELNLLKFLLFFRDYGMAVIKNIRF
jgi:hypothetical protein